MLNYEDTLRYLTEWAEGSVLDREDEEALRSAIVHIKNGKEAAMRLTGYQLREKYGNEQPRPLSLDELRNYPEGSVLWKDDRNPDDGAMNPMYPVRFEGIGPAIVDKEQEAILFSDGCDYAVDYSLYFVLWTGWPTDEQRKAVKWDG